MTADSESLGGEIVGESRAIRDMRERIRRYAPSDLPVLLSGPRGSEIERAARAIHQQSRRAAGPYCRRNIAALARELVAEELFGRSRRSGGSARSRVGALAKAHRGTLFLDAIEKLPAPAQDTLLEALETGQFRSVGAPSLQSGDVRLVAAARETLGFANRRGSFSRELLNVLSTVEIRIPPLDERVEDIPLLAARHLDDLNARYARSKRIGEDVVAALASRAWPGELQELCNEVSRLFFACDGDIDDPSLVHAPRAPSTSSERMPASYLLEDVERAAIARALEATGRNKDRTAQLLGISRAGLYKKMKRLGMDES